MKRSPLYMTAVVMFTCFTLKTSAQSDMAQVIQAGLADANTLANAYAEPVMKAMGAGINSGWFQTAKPHGLGGFDITICANPVLIPSGAKNFDVSSLNLNNVRLASGQPSNSPTVFGPDQNGPLVEVRGKNPLTGTDTTLRTFNLPKGMDARYFAVPTAQLAVGVGLGTEIAVRFVPTIGVKDFGVSMFGFGIKHDLKQWIPVVKDLPFDLSGMFGYTSLKGHVNLSGDNAISPENDPNVYNPNPSKSYNDQKLDFKSTGWTVNLLISKKLGPVTPYLGLGYQRAKTELNFKGTYPITVPNEDAATPGPAFGKPGRIEDVVDPVSISSTISGARATAGVRLKLAVLTLHADYTFATYNVLSVGVGLNIQSLVPPSI